MREFLARNFVDHDWLDPSDEWDRARIPAHALEHGSFPVIVFPDATLLPQPSLRQLAEAVGLQTVPAAEGYDVVIIGGGPSGLSAAVYGASEGLHTLMVEGTAPGGQAGTSSRIENHLGFLIGMAGDQLASRALTQTCHVCRMCHRRPTIGMLGVMVVRRRQPGGCAALSRCRPPTEVPPRSVSSRCRSPSARRAASARSPGSPRPA